MCAFLYVAFKDNLEAFDVLIGGGAFIHTVRVCDNPDLCCNSSTPNVPLVMVHGIGGAIPTFYKNYQLLAIDRCVYGIDMPGFGLSKRVEFPNEPEACEKKMVDMIDQWREVMKINKMILLGHSFGGYVTAAYALRHHEHVQHLVLLDPWGVFSKEEDRCKRKQNMLEKVSRSVCKHLRVDPFEKFASFGTMLSNYIGTAN